MKTDTLYLQLAQRVLDTGEEVEDRTGTGTISLPHQRLQFDLQDEFPILQSKKVSFHAIKHELLWFLSGDTNAKYLKDNNVKIWDEWLNADNEAGLIYGHNWRNFGARGMFAIDGVDQMNQLINDLKNNPKSRRMIVTSWNPKDQRDGFLALPPCHCFFQVTTHGGKINLMLHQRSVDVFLGLPFNITSYALLMHMLAEECGMDVGLLTMNFGDCHIYKNHVDQIKEQLSRKDSVPKNESELYLDSFDSFFEKDDDSVQLYNHNPMSAIKAPVSV